jgi:N-ethylmaleimide reductase
VDDQFRESIKRHPLLVWLEVRLTPVDVVAEYLLSVHSIQNQSRLVPHPVPMSNFPHLLAPLQVGDLHLAHRVVMAPLTRMRSTQPGDIPNPLNAEYYAQRATHGGLLISEATQISLQGKGYPAAPGIHSPEQVEGWKLVTEAVHAKGGFIFLQLWHVGRISHSSFRPDSLAPEARLPVSASAIAPEGGKAMTADFKQVPYETPRALELDEIPGIIADYRRAAENAQAAGFDGVEVHSANGYLLDQFLEDRTNHRTDAYGGSIENRARLLLEVVDSVVDVWGKGRVGVRLSPFGKFSDMGDSDPEALFGYVLRQLSGRAIAYAHLIEPRAGNAGGGAPIDDSQPRSSHVFRKSFQGVLIAAGGYTAESAEEAISEGFADAVAFGRLFIANPDLPERFRLNAPLNTPDRRTFYGGTAKGYTDYPTLDTVAAV